MTIYIFGNPLIEEDNLPFKLIPDLQKNFPTIDFVEMDPNENLKPINKELIIIDTAVGINKVTLIEDIEKIETEDSYSMHDMDLAFNLKLLHKIGELKKIKIFAVPQNIQKEKALKELINMIQKTLHQPELKNQTNYKM